MLPVALLMVFALLAVGAVIAFTILTLVESTPRREDWKKFLGSFAGTTLAISVGFISFMLQQQSQARLASTAEQNAERRKHEDESAQLKTRLLYSVVQKKFELSLLLDFDVTKEIRSERMCDTALDRAQRDNRFKEFRLEADKMSPGDMKALLSALFSNPSYERNAIVRLLRDTNLATRIPQEMVSTFLEDELGLHAMGPLILIKTTDLLAISNLDSFCSETDWLKDRSRQAMEGIARFQLSACGVLGTIDLPTRDARERAEAIHKKAAQYRVGAEKIDTLIADISSTLGTAKDGFQACMETANSQLIRIP